MKRSLVGSRLIFPNSLYLYIKELMLSSKTRSRGNKNFELFVAAFPDNKVAIKLCESCGFALTNEDIEDIRDVF